MSNKTTSKSASSTLTSTKSKLLEESNTKTLRDLSQINKNCFDCGQRGPTYVNVTVGTFVCMSCSGVLRGLTPPHRVKSISMATFTQEEINLLKSRGNEYNRKTWLATLTTPPPTKKEELKQHMSCVYEQKRYFREMISDDPHRDDTLRTNDTPSNHVPCDPPSNPSPIMNNLRPHLPNSITLPDIKPLSSLLGNHSINFINNLSETKVINVDNFANFDEAFNEPFADFESIQKPLVPFNSGGNSCSGGGGVNLNFNVGGGGSGDRYAALKDLDEAFKYGDSPGLTNSASVPLNLSHSGFQVNPFSQDRNHIQQDKKQPNNNPFFINQNPSTSTQFPPPQQNQNNNFMGQKVNPFFNPHNPFL